jgi:NAD(P)-dependent dehydrogenase (short-subunit alcohol dehydrogenase family)
VSRLDGKVALVTGGASGIGREAVRRFVAEGARVVAGDLNEDLLGALADELGDAVAVQRSDVTVEADVEALAALAVDRFGRLDIAFANAGIGAITRLVDADADMWKRVLDVNLTGPFLTIKHAARGMGAYCSSKAGVAMLTQVAALELGPAGIRVNAVGPGLVRTPLTEGGFAFPGIVDGYVENTPLGRYATPEEIAGLVAWLASDEASYVSGSLYLIDGGAHTMRYPDLIEIVSRPMEP